MTSDICAHGLHPIEMMIFCERCKKYRNFTLSSGAETLRKWTVFADHAIHLKICANCPLTENLRIRKSEEILALYAGEATFAIIYLCPLFSAGWSFSIKYDSYDSLKILLSFRIAKNGMILKIAPPHILIWSWTSIYFHNSVRQIVVCRYLIFFKALFVFVLYILLCSYCTLQCRLNSYSHN